jgi:hypothetical protein
VFSNDHACMDLSHVTTYPICASGAHFAIIDAVKVHIIARASDTYSVLHPLQSDMACGVHRLTTASGRGDDTHNSYAGL